MGRAAVDETRPLGNGVSGAFIDVGYSYIPGYAMYWDMQF